MIKNIKWILFDFGGCLDSDGIHSRTLFFNQFVKHQLISAEKDFEHFQNAYSYSDRTVISNSLVVNSELNEMNELMCYYIAKYLDLTQIEKIKKTAQAITLIQSNHLIRNKTILEKLKANYHLGIISNFSGNLEIILKEFSLDSYFDFVLDSYHLKITKPDPAIFKLAIKNCQVDPHDICFIGDNPKRDIDPAHALKMKTILISPHLKNKNSNADYHLTSVVELFALTQII